MFFKLYITLGHTHKKKTISKINSQRSLKHIQSPTLLNRSSIESGLQPGFYHITRSSDIKSMDDGAFLQRRSTAIQAAHTHFCKFQFWTFLVLPEGSQQKVYRQERRLLFLPQTAPNWLVTLTRRGGCRLGKSPGVAITVQQAQATVNSSWLSLSNSNCDSVMPGENAS